MQTTKSMLVGFGGAALLLFSLAALLVLVLSGTFFSRSNRMSPIVFGHLATPTSTNADYVCLTVSNRSDSTVVYLACPAQVKSNGIWSGSPFPTGQRMTRLTARQSGVMVIKADSVTTDTRVPVLWGFNDYTGGAKIWRQLLEDIAARAKGHGGVGLLYTNYLTDIKL